MVSSEQKVCQKESWCKLARLLVRIHLQVASKLVFPRMISGYTHLTVMYSALIFHRRALFAAGPTTSLVLEPIGFVLEMMH
jgi:hypothetical protein